MTIRNQAGENRGKCSPGRGPGRYKGPEAGELGYLRNDKDPCGCVQWVQEGAVGESWSEKEELGVVRHVVV